MYSDEVLTKREVDKLDEILDNLTYWLFGYAKDGVLVHQREFAYHRAWIDHLVSTNFECGCGIGEDAEQHYCDVWEAMKKVRDAEQRLAEVLAKQSKGRSA